MTLSFNNLTQPLEEQFQKFAQSAQHKNERFFWMDIGHEVEVIMEKALWNPGVPEEAQSSAYKKIKDTATVTVMPPNEKLSNIITDFFKSKVIPTEVGAPERSFFDSVTINGETVI